MTNEERLEFLKQKPTYPCWPGKDMHSVGCPCKWWSRELLQKALDNCRRAEELRIHLLNKEDV